MQQRCFYKQSCIDKKVPNKLTFQNTHGLRSENRFILKKNDIINEDFAGRVFHSGNFTDWRAATLLS